MIRAVLVDDEAHVRKNLKTILNSNFNNIQIVGEGDSVVSATTVIKETLPDVVFLDIDLSDGSGFNVLDNCCLIATKFLSLIRSRNDCGTLWT